MGQDLADALEPGSSIELYWIPLGAGARVVRFSGKLFEAIAAFAHRRRPLDLFHSALKVVVPEGTFIIEMGPVADRDGKRRGVVAEGPVGTRWAGRPRHFRYEIRCSRDGVIADAGDAVASPVMVTNDVSIARRILALVPSVPTPVWGRDELATGDMWNSNSVTSWVLDAGGVDTSSITLPPGGRAPGWHAGLVVAARQRAALRTDAGRDGSAMCAHPSRRSGGGPASNRRFHRSNAATDEIEDRRLVRAERRVASVRSRLQVV
jgi:hypothetical protein